MGISQLSSLLACCALSRAAAAITWFPAAGPTSTVLWEGRTLVDAATGSATFDWPGVRASFVVQATSTVYARLLAPGSVRGLFRVRVDGVNASSVLVDSSASVYVLASGLDATAPHTIELASALEPALLHPQPFLPSPPYEALTLSAVGVEASGSLAGPLAPPSRRLAFVGDSITAGFGAGGEPPDCPNPSTYSEDNLVTYGRLLCARFSAACDVVAWSGKGLMVNSPTAGTNQTLPTYYTQTLGAGQAPYEPTWDFSFVPDAVVVNLGTNDQGHGHDTGPAWEANFTETYVHFMANLTVWHGNAHLAIFAASGPLTSRLAAAIQAAVVAHNANGGRAVFLDLMIGRSVGGCYGHPSARDHADMAALAAPVMAAALGWQLPEELPGGAVAARQQEGGGAPGTARARAP